MAIEKVLIAGKWRDSDHHGTFSSFNPSTKEKLKELYPISTWQDCELALQSAQSAFKILRETPSQKIADFLDAYANKIEARKDELVQSAHLETGLPKSPRLADGELPRCVLQIRQAATAARSQSWVRPIIDSKINLRSMLGPLGPVVVFGPNNFPYAYGSISGGDFASAIAAGNPVIAKAHPSHPKTTQIFAEEAQKAADETGLPAGTVQLMYMLDNKDGLSLVSEPRVAATGFTGSQKSGVALKNAAEKAGNLIYLEMSSINPVSLLPGAIKERGAKELADEFSASCLMGSGQFCTNPGLVFLLKGEESEGFIAKVTENFNASVGGVLLSEGVESSLTASLKSLIAAGATLLTRDNQANATALAYSLPNTLLKITALQFLAKADVFQEEAFGNASLMVLADSVDQVCEMIDCLQGNLTASVYSDSQGSEEEAYTKVASALRTKVGRLLNDQMPTGVAVSDAMNHGGPYPSTGHPVFTAVGFPSSVARFSMLCCYDKVRDHRLPEALQDANPKGLTRLVDGLYV